MSVFNKYFIIFFFVIILLGCKNQKMLAGNSPCKRLQMLTDSNSSYFAVRTPYDNLIITINSLFNKTKMIPSWQCDFIGCHYPSLSLRKSVFKIDLIRLIEFYQCPKTLLRNSEGEFSSGDIELINLKNKYKNELNIDTMLLYRKSIHISN